MEVMSQAERTYSLPRGRGRCWRGGGRKGGKQYTARENLRSASDKRGSDHHQIQRNYGCAGNLYLAGTMMTVPSPNV